jgi:hypothetical protein
MSAPPPSTQYGSNPSDRSSQSPYHVNPYEVPPPPSPQRPGNRIGIIVGVVLLVLLLIGGGVFALLQYSSARNAAAVAALATTTAQATASASVAVQTFTAKGTITIVSSTTTNVQQDGSNTISSITQQAVIYGDIMGSYMSEETLILHLDKTGNFSGRSTCTCTVAGKSGTLMWSYTGTSTANGSFQGQFFDVHGTGDLAKLHGQGEFQGQGVHGSYSSELHFDAYTGTGSPVITEFAIPTQGGIPYEITAGPDGNLWFTEIQSNKIGRISPTGTISEFSLPTAGSVPGDIALGPDGNLWFTEIQSNKIGRISPTGTISEFSLPTAGSQPLGIALGPDKQLWFIENGSNKIGRISALLAPSASSRYPLLTAGPLVLPWAQTAISGSQRF